MAGHGFAHQLLMKRPRKWWDGQEVINDSKVKERISHLDRRVRQTGVCELEQSGPSRRGERHMSLRNDRMFPGMGAADPLGPAFFKTKASRQFRLKPGRESRPSGQQLLSPAANSF